MGFDVDNVYATGDPELDAAFKNMGVGGYGDPELDALAKEMGGEDWGELE